MGFISLGDVAQEAAGGAVTVAGGAAASVAAGTAWVPFVGPIVAGVSLLVGWLTGKNAVYHAQEAAATKVVNAIEPALQQNLADYLHCKIDQQTALDKFDQLWALEQQQCSQIPGPAGQRCISDRQAGACTWKNDGKGGPAGSGDVCWNWDVGYHQPLLQTPPCSSLAPGGFSLSPAVLLAGGALLLLGANA